MIKLVLQFILTHQFWDAYSFTFISPLKLGYILQLLWMRQLEAWLSQAAHLWAWLFSLGAWLWSLAFSINKPFEKGMWVLVAVRYLSSDLSGKIKKHQHQTCHSLEKSLETIAEHCLKPCSTTHALDGTGDNITWNVTDDDDFATRSYSEALGCESEEVLEISIYFTFTFLCWYYIKCNTIKIYV